MGTGRLSSRIDDGVAQEVGLAGGGGIRASHDQDPGRARDFGALGN
jgi:hypothetical protein